jgi:hypothetical protein
VREVEELVAGHRRGDRPEDPTEPDLHLRGLRFDVRPETYAMFRAVEQRLAREAGRPVTDDEVVAAMCRAVLAPAVPAETHVGRANTPHYQVAMTICQECGRGWQDGAGRTVEVGPAAIATACCDAQIIGRVDGDAPTRMTRTIPAATRRLVLRRDHGRCVVPGCRSSRWIDVHHLSPRARGGGHAMRNLAAMCSSHHALLHDGRLMITGEPGRLRFWNGDGSPWASAPAPDSETSSTIRSALRKLGFTADEAAAAAAVALSQVGADATIEQQLTAALRACRPRGADDVHGPRR